jgi:hypothetical protein
VRWTCRAFDIRVLDIVKEASSFRSMRRMVQMVISPILKARSA